MVGRPAWCHILSEENVSFISPNPSTKTASWVKDGKMGKIDDEEDEKARIEEATNL